jgi:hypothetical protein
MRDMIEPVIDQSLAIAHARAPVGDVAHGIVAALRRMRAAIEDAGGYGMVSILDGAIRDRLIIRNLRDMKEGCKGLPARLPSPGRAATLAETIMVGAADTCLIYSAQTPDSNEVILTVFLLLDRLIETLHAVPELGDLLEWLQDAEEEAAALAGESVFDGPAASVH